MPPFGHAFSAICLHMPNSFFFQFQTFEVVKIIVDPRYDAGHYKYDGCILKTSEPVTSAYGYEKKPIHILGLHIIS